jgi:hypothetical protein
MAHFLVAFFSVHLKGDLDYQKYYSEEFVDKFDILTWGHEKQRLTEVQVMHKSNCLIFSATLLWV